MFEVIYSVDVKNEANTIDTKRKYNMTDDDTEGFSLWYLNSPPTGQNDFSNSFGYRSDFNGLAIFVFKHENRWRILAVYNQGIAGLTVHAAVNNLSKYCHLYSISHVVVFLM